MTSLFDRNSNPFPTWFDALVLNIVGVVANSFFLWVSGRRILGEDFYYWLFQMSGVTVGVWLTYALVIGVRGFRRKRVKGFDKGGE